MIQLNVSCDYILGNTVFKIFSFCTKKPVIQTMVNNSFLMKKVKSLLIFIFSLYLSSHFQVKDVKNKIVPVYMCITLN